MYENLVADILAEGMKMCEVLQANVLIEKLPDSWFGYRNHLKHKKKDMTLEELIGHMKIEEANRLKDKASPSNELAVKANIVESSVKISDRNNKGKKPAANNNQNQNKQLGVQNKKGKNFKKSSKGQKSNPTCYVCGMAGHKAWQCNQRKDKNNDQNNNNNHAHIVENSNDIIAAVVSEINLVGDKTEWIVDTGATKHFCADKELFADFVEANQGEQVFMGNSSSSEVLGKGSVILKLNSGKSLSLQNVMYVPSLRRNLISGALLNKAGVKLVFEGDKLVLSRNGEFVGKGYLSGGLFVLETIPTVMNKISTSAYLLESYDLWHARLGHVSYGSMKRLQHMSLIPNLNGNDHSKCEVCVGAKYTKKTF